MTIPLLKIKVLPKTSIKGKMDVRFPAVVEAVSPIILDKVSGRFTFTLDISSLSSQLVAVPISALAAQASLTVLANNTGSSTSPTAVTYPAFADNLFGSATVGAVATRFGSQWGATSVGLAGQPLIGSGAGNPASFGNASANYSVFTNTGTGAASRTVSSRLTQVKNVFDYGAVGDGTTDDTTAIQNAINAAQNAAALGNRSHGKVFAPPGYTFKVTTGLLINSPIDVEFLSHIVSASTAGTVLTINSVTPAFGYQDFQLDFAGFEQTGGNSSQPLSVNAAGLTAVRVNGMAFCRLRIGVLLGFTNMGLYCDGTGGLGWQQVIQHNTIILGQVIFNGYGIFMDSASAATSSCQVCRWDIQNIYGNYTCIRMNNSASDSHSFWINAMDNAQQYGIQCSGGWNNFYVGYTAAPIRFETGAKYNTVHVSNTLATGVSFTDVDGYGTSNNKMFSSGTDWATQVGSYVRLDQLTPPSGDVSFNNHKAAFLADPSAAQDAATKNYVDGAAWTAYTPTLGCGTGALTSASATGRYRVVGKTVFFQQKITITTNGTAATFITSTLPAGMTVKDDTFFGGKARAVSGKLVGSAVQAAGNTLAIANYDNTYPGANGEIIVISGSFEAA